MNIKLGLPKLTAQVGQPMKLNYVVNMDQNYINQSSNNNNLPKNNNEIMEYCMNNNEIMKLHTKNEIVELHK